MKKIILAVAVVFFSTSAFAQHFEYGVKAGLNLATVTNTDGQAKFRPGIHAGAFAEYVINDYVGVQAELLYSMQGYRMKEDGATATVKLDYIVLPVLAKIYVVPEKLSLYVGPQFGYMVSAKIKAEVDGNSVTENIYDNDGLKKFDVSASMGLSYRLPYNLEVSAGYNLGLTKIGDGGDAKNSVIQIAVGYRF